MAPRAYDRLRRARIVRLRFGARGPKRFQRQTSGLNCQEAWIAREIAAEAPRVAELWDEVQVGPTWLIPETEGRILVQSCQSLFKGSQG
jgi:hypothetical protein